MRNENQTSVDIGLTVLGLLNLPILSFECPIKYQMPQQVTITFTGLVQAASNLELFGHLSLPWALHTRIFVFTSMQNPCTKNHLDAHAHISSTWIVCETMLQAKAILNYNFVPWIEHNLAMEEIWEGKLWSRAAAVTSLQCPSSMLHYALCIAPLSNIGSDPSESIWVIGVVVVINLKMTDPLKCVWVTLDSSGYSTNQGSCVSSRGLWYPIRTIINKNCPNKKKDILEFREKWYCEVMYDNALEVVSKCISLQINDFWASWLTIMGEICVIIVSSIQKAVGRTYHIEEYIEKI